MASEKGERKNPGFRSIAIVILFATVAGILYRPLPVQYTKTTTDRLTMYVIEPLMRIGYYYPKRMCPNAHCIVHWTRWSTATFTWAIGPRFDWDSELIMQTTLWDGVKVRVYHPTNRASAQSDGAILFMHGGGFGVGSTEVYESLTRTMTKQIRPRLFVSIDYRLSPETVFPGALEDCERVLQYVIANGPSIYGIDPKKIIVMGDSAGGNLAAAMTQRRRDRAAKPEILGQVLLYPMLQMSDMRTYSYRHVDKAMKGLACIDAFTIAFYYLLYAGVEVNEHPEFVQVALANGHVNEQAKAVRERTMNHAFLPESFRNKVNCTDDSSLLSDELMEYMAPFLTNPSFAPLMQHNLSALPSALVITCEFDVLRDDGIIYARRLEQAGVPTQWTHYVNGFHGMLNLHAQLEIADEALQEINKWTMELLRQAEVDHHHHLVQV